VQLVINTMSNIYEDRGDGTPVFKDGFEIRRAAVERRIPCLTSLDTATALLESAVAAPHEMEVRTIEEWRESLPMSPSAIEIPLSPSGSNQQAKRAFSAPSLPGLPEGQG